MEDTFKTLREPAEAVFKEKMSRFLAFAIPVNDVEEIKGILSEYQKKYYDARHICYAYMLGHDRLDFRANDNGEPSGTAGKPILGQINSFELTNVLVLVVRYFGGIKLGTGGLVVAYREAAKLALESAEIVEKTVDHRFDITFDYIAMNDVMKTVKEEVPEVLFQRFDTLCTMTLAIRKALANQLYQRLSKIESLRFMNDSDLLL